MGFCSILFDHSNYSAINLTCTPPINFILSSFLLSCTAFLSFSCVRLPFIWVFFCWSPSLFPQPASLMCVVDVRCVCVVRWQPAAATHSSPLWRKNQGRRAPTARSPLPLPADPPPRGLTLTLLLTRYCKPNPGNLQSPADLPHVTTSLSILA